MLKRLRKRLRKVLKITRKALKGALRPKSAQPDPVDAPHVHAAVPEHGVFEDRVSYIPIPDDWLVDDLFGAIRRLMKQREKKMRKRSQSPAGRVSEVPSDPQPLLTDDDILKQISDTLTAIRRDQNAILRKLYVDPHELAYPFRVTANRFRIYSQNEEDGITYGLIREIGNPVTKLVEIGCGQNGGNSAFLAFDLGWSGLMLDGDEQKIHLLKARYSFQPARHQAAATWITRENINELIRKAGFSGEIDSLSIDLDGVDFWIWDGITECNPRIVIIEYNSCFGPQASVTVPYDSQFSRKRYSGYYYGASLQALVKLGRRKGFRLVAVEPRGANAFFLRNDLCPQIPEVSPQDAYIMLDKHYNMLLRDQVDDVVALIKSRGWELVEV